MMSAETFEAKIQKLEDFVQRLKADGKNGGCLGHEDLCELDAIVQALRSGHAALRDEVRHELLGIILQHDALEEEWQALQETVKSAYRNAAERIRENKVSLMRRRRIAIWSFTLLPLVLSLATGWWASQLADPSQKGYMINVSAGLVMAAVTFIIINLAWGQLEEQRASVEAALHGLRDIRRDGIAIQFIVKDMKQVDAAFIESARAILDGLDDAIEMQKKSEAAQEKRWREKVSLMTAFIALSAGFRARQDEDAMSGNGE